MNCPKCGESDWAVLDSRWVKVSRHVTEGIRRRRQCQVCGHRMTTYEVPAADLQRLQGAVKAVSRLHPILGEIARLFPGEVGE